MDSSKYLVWLDEVLWPDETMEESQNKQDTAKLLQVELFHEDSVHMPRCEPNMDVY